MMKSPPLAPQGIQPDVVQTIADFMRGYSLEATRPSIEDIAALCAIAPAGSRVYVSAVPGQRPDDIVDHCVRLRGSGFEPVPHIAIRAYATATALDRTLARLAGEAGARRVLVIAGDRDAPAGGLRSALEVIDGGLLLRHGIREVGIAGYPEGHPRIPRHELDRALADKIAAAQETGLKIHIVTQFGFDATAIIGWLRRLRDFGFDAPVRIGLAGPTSLPTLMRYAHRCGVIASAHGLARHAGLLRNLFAMSAPDAIVRALAVEWAGHRLGDVRPHFFSFGGLLRTARWAAAAEQGRIALENGQGFRVEPAA
jgi:methylenetetrahydrofolate reductase (NADPH)